MTVLVNRVSYFFDILKKYLEGVDCACPNCGSKESRLVTTKYLVLQLRRCNNCLVMYKVPKQDPDENRLFYQKDYNEPGLTSEFPVEQELAFLIKTNFRNSEKDFSGQIELIRSIKKSGSLLDFGSSWGYGVYQFNQAGFKAIGYDISKRMAEFGREKLGVEIICLLDSLKNTRQGSFDIIFSSHVFEHLPYVNDYLSLFHNLLKQEGIIVIIVPNCNGIDNKETAVKKKSYAFGKKHNFAFDDLFWRHNLPRLNFKLLELSQELRIIAQKS